VKHRDFPHLKKRIESLRELNFYVLDMLTSSFILYVLFSEDILLQFLHLNIATLIFIHTIHILGRTLIPILET